MIIEVSQISLVIEILFIYLFFFYMKGNFLINIVYNHKTVLIHKKKKKTMEGCDVQLVTITCLHWE